MNEPKSELLPRWRRWLPLVGSISMVGFWAVWIGGDHGDAAWLHRTGWEIALWSLLGLGLGGIAISLLDSREQRRGRADEE